MKSTFIMIFAILGPAAALQDSGPFFPLHAGHRWTYRVTGGGETTVTVGESKEIRESVFAWSVEGFGSSPYLFVEKRDGIEILADGGTTIADLRWGGEYEWTFWNGSREIRCTAYGVGLTTMPAGTFRCFTIRVGEETFSLAEGVGIVRWTRAEYGTEVTWELASYDLSGR